MDNAPVTGDGNYPDISEDGHYFGKTGDWGNAKQAIGFDKVVELEYVVKRGGCYHNYWTH